MPTQKTIDLDREKVIVMIEKILEQPVGTELFIPCTSKKNQQDTHRCLIRELRARSEFAPEDTEQITHKIIFRDSKFWVVLQKTEPQLTKFFIKSDNGSVSKIDFSEKGES